MCRKLFMGNDVLSIWMGLTSNANILYKFKGRHMHINVEANVEMMQLQYVNIPPFV